MKDLRLDDLAGLLTISTSFLIGLVLLLNSLSALPFVSLSTVRDPLAKAFGILAFVFGTLYVALLALAIAAPVGVLSAIYLARYAPRAFRRYYSIIIEAMAGVPSVVYGLWGLLVLGELIGTPNGSKLLASLTLSFMLLPTIISLSKEAIESVPMSVKEAAYALGAMDHEVALVALGYSKAYILASVLLALMRAIGETMAVTMTVGNIVGISMNPLDPASTLTSLIATEFGGAMDPVHRSAILFAAFLLFLISLSIYAIAKEVIGHEKGGSREGLQAHHALLHAPSRDACASGDRIRDLQRPRSDLPGVLHGDSPGFRSGRPWRNSPRDRRERIRDRRRSLYRSPLRGSHRGLLVREEGLKDP